MPVSECLFAAFSVGTGEKAAQMLYGTGPQNMSVANGAYVEGLVCRFKRVHLGRANLGRSRRPARVGLSL